MRLAKISVIRNSSSSHAFHTPTNTVPGVIPLLSPVVTSEASLEQHVYVFPDIFCIILLDDLLQS
jgi:hypothetical protein